MNEKVIGYILLGAGIFVMVFALINVFLLLTGKIKPISVFANLNQESAQIAPTPTQQMNVSELAKTLKSGGNISNLLPTQQLFPTALINQTLDMTTHFFLMSFLLGFGYKIASLGTMMARPIVVKLRTASEDKPQNP